MAVDEIPDDLEREILSAYSSPGHPIAFSTPNRVAKHFHVTLAQARKVLQQLDSYNLHKEYKRTRYFNPYFIYSPTYFQSDLIDMKKLAPYNNGIAYLCVIICVFSRKLWVYPLRRKTTQDMVNILDRWLDELPLHVKVKQFTTDFGKEYTNAPVQQLFARRGIRFQGATGTCKASYAERVNKTLQLLIYKYLTNNETVKYIDVLDELVKTYNKRGHRSLSGMSPDEAFQKKNRAYVLGLHMERYAKVPRLKPRLELGDVVRVKSAPTTRVATASRSYVKQYKPEYFIITRVNKKLPIPMYYLKSMDTLDDIEGSFYANELSRVIPNVFKIERVIRWRGKRPRREALVRWAHFGPDHDSWVPEADITRVFDNN